MPKWQKIVAVTVLSLAVLVALVFLALPPLLKYLAVKKIDEATGRKSRIAEISLNPFTLHAGISGFSLSEKGGGAPFLTFSSARLSLSPLSLPKRSFIVTGIELSSPYLHLVRTAPNRFNFSDLLTEKKEKKKEGTPYFSLNNITVKNGSIDFQDLALRAPKQHRINGMDIALPFVSNMPYLADRYVQPHFSATVNGSPVRFDGRLKPLTRAVEAVVSLNLKHVDLPFYLGYLPSPLPVQVPSGRLGTALELGYRVDEKKGPEFRVSGDVALDDLALREPSAAPLASIGQARMRIRAIEVLGRRVDIDSLDVKGFELFGARDRGGAWNFSRLTSGDKKPATAAAEKNEPKKAKLDLKLSRLSLEGGKLHLTDAVPPGGFKTDLQGLELKVEDFTLAGEHPAPFDLRFRTARGETASFSGRLAATPVDLQANLALKGVPLKDYYPYMREQLASPVSGTVGLTSEVIYNDARGVVLQNASFEGDGLAAPFVRDEGVRLTKVLVKGITVDIKRNLVDVASADVKGGRIAVSSEPGGAYSYRHLLRPKKEGPKSALAETREQRRRRLKSTHAAPFSYRVRKVTGSGLSVSFTDRTREAEPRFSLSGLRFSVAGIAGPKQGRLPVTLAAVYGKKGRLEANGTVNPDPAGFSGKVALHGIPLRDFDAYIPEDTTVFIADGALDTELALNVEKAASGVRGSFSGEAGVRSFYCQDTELNEDLLKWERLQLDRVKGTLSPFTLAISDVSLSNFYSRVIIEKDGTLNLQHLRGEGQDEQSPPAAQNGKAAAPRQAVAPATAGKAAPDKSTAPGTAQTAATAPAAGESPAQPHPIRIDAITMQGGTLDFSDRHLDAPFDTTFYNLGGRVSGLTSQANRFADVDLRGNLENHSPLSIKGVINPLRGDLYLDLKIAFSDIELSPLTPYATTYLGYNVDKGKLSLDLNYKIDKKALTSQNKVFIDQFTFGKQVESPKATKLPVRLAIALLKDRKGEIHLDLPVAGRTDDPKFSVWKVVLQMLKNLLVKAATSPLSLLGSMFGGGEDFSAVAFQPGSERIDKPEQEKLLKLSKALHDRPALNVDVSGFVDRERDPEGYRDEMLMKKMKGEKFRKLVKEGKAREGQTQQETVILPDEYRVYLKEVYVKEKFPKPRNALGFLKDLPEPEMKKLIVAHTVVGQSELQTLARERAGVVKAFLVQEGKIAPERIFEKNADIYKAPAKEGAPASRVEFGASVK